MARSVLQDNEAAIEDLNTCLNTDASMMLALWQRAVCQVRMAQFLLAEGSGVELRLGSALSDFTQALTIQPRNAFLHYDRANVYAMQQRYDEAINDYSAAIEADPRLSEAFYNRALCRIHAGNTADAIADLSRAGELGLYQAYSIIKKYTNNNGR